MDITTGVMNIHFLEDPDEDIFLDDALGDIQAWIDLEWLTGYGGAGDVLYSYNVDTELITLSAVPEPTTLMLIGLGGVLIRRKRK